MKSLPAEIARSLELREDGKSFAEIADLLGRAESTVQNWVAQYGGVVRETKAHREIVAAWRAGCGSVSCLAKRLGRSPNTVRRHLRRAGWVASCTTSIGQRRPEEEPEPTEDELEALIAERMKCLPNWWRLDCPREEPPMRRFGRAAVMIPTKSYRVMRALRGGR